MAATRISIYTTLAKEADQGLISRVGNTKGTLGMLAEFIMAIAGGLRAGKVRVNTGAVQAEGALAFASFADADTVTINGVVLTGKTSPSGASQFAVGASDEACANNLYTLLKASALDKIVGVVVPYRRGTILLSSFADGDTVTINGLVFTGKTTPDDADPRQFLIGGTDSKTAEFLLQAINKCKALYPTYLGKELIAASRATATLTIDMDRAMTFANSAHATLSNKIVQIRSIVGGQIGNLMTLAISAHGSKTDPTGGTEGTEAIHSGTLPIL